MDIVRLAAGTFLIDIDYWLFDEIEVEDYAPYQRTELRSDQFRANLFAAKLRQLREQRGMAERELGQALDLSRAYIYNLEAGRVQPSPDSIILIAKYFGITAAALLDDGISVDASGYDG